MVISPQRGHLRAKKEVGNDSTFDHNMDIHLNDENHQHEPPPFRMKSLHDRQVLQEYSIRKVGGGFLFLAFLWNRIRGYRRKTEGEDDRACLMFLFPPPICSPRFLGSLSELKSALMKVGSTSSLVIPHGFPFVRFSGGISCRFPTKAPSGSVFLILPFLLSKRKVDLSNRSFHLLFLYSFIILAFI